MADICGSPYGWPHAHNGQTITILVDQDHIEVIHVWNSKSRGHLHSSPHGKLSHLNCSSPISGWGEAELRSVFLLFSWSGNYDSDQLCSFIFTLSNTSLFICVYLGKFADDWQKCQNSSRTWPIAFVLASIPFVIRLVQCVKCYIDSQLILHLVNVRFLLFCSILFSNVGLWKAGKYGTGILSYLFYFMWSYRRKNEQPVLPLYTPNWLSFLLQSIDVVRFLLCGVFLIRAILSMRVLGYVFFRLPYAREVHKFYYAGPLGGLLSPAATQQASFSSNGTYVYSSMGEFILLCICHCLTYNMHLMHISRCTILRW